MERKGIFSLAYVCILLQQVYFVLTCTVWRGVIIIPNALFRPEITAEYWSWYLDEYSPGAGGTLAVGISWAADLQLPLIFLLTLVFIVKDRKFRQPSGRKWAAVVVVAALAALAAVVAYGKVAGQPFYLALGALRGEVLSLMVLALLVLTRRKSE